MLEQHIRERVENEIVTPMVRLYPQPYGMKDEAVGGALEEYVEALAEFDRDTLKKAWQRLRDSWNQKRWPDIPACLDACREVRRAEQPADANKIQYPPDWWRLVEVRYRNYLRRFLKGKLYDTAHKEGWHVQLRDFVEKAAWIQAQICETYVVLGRDPNVPKYYTKEERERFRLYSMRAEGDISVDVTAEQLAGMKVIAAKCRKTTATPAPGLSGISYAPS